MKTSIILLICICTVFISCTKTEQLTNEQNSKDETTIYAADIRDYKIQLNIEGQNEENTNLMIFVFSDSESEEEINKSENETAFQMEPINESISKQFIYEFPKIIDFDEVTKYTYSILDFSDEEKSFYEKYVGCYLTEEELSKEYLSSHLSEVTIKFIENEIVFWEFCKSGKGIHYDANEKQFYEYGAFDTMPIKNISDFQVSEKYEKNGYKKITDCQLINDIISEKKEKMNRPVLTEIEEHKLRTLLFDFFTKLTQKEYDKIIDNYFISINDRDEIKNTLFWQGMDLRYQNSTFDIYINVFFNDNIENYDEDTIFVELKYRHPINYVSYAIKEIDGELKILNYVARYDEE